MILECFLNRDLDCLFFILEGFDWDLNGYAMIHRDLIVFFSMVG